MSPDGEHSLSRFFEEFHCQECGGEEAYRSRARGFAERYLLPLLLMRPVRCERCYHRAYVMRTISVPERKPSGRGRPESQPQGESGSRSRIA